MPTQHHTQTITLDNREAKLIELFRQAAIPIQTMNLPIGDIIIKHTLDLQQDVLALAEPPKERRITYEIILERKCTQDMVASIKDGRYKEQKIRLLAEGKNTTPDRSVVIGYIIEGTPAELRAPADKTMLLGSIISSTFRDNISILRTNSLQETFDLLVRLNERMMKDYNEFFPNSTNRCAESAVDQTFSASDSSGCGVAGVGGNDSYLASIKKNKKDNMTPSMWNMACLCGIPGVSSAIAIKIAERYPTLRALLDAYLACPDIVGRENLLADIILTETEKQRRRIGGVVSKRVYEYIHM
jgi:crossover junction endonuclease MUS81